MQMWFVSVQLLLSCTQSVKSRSGKRVLLCMGIFPKSGHIVRLLHCIVPLMSSSLEAIISHCDLARHTKEDNIETK